LKIKVKRGDFTYPQTVWIIMGMMDEKYGKDSEVGLGARILRRGLWSYKSTVNSIRIHNDR
jgi:hypothetical protein